MVVAEHVAAGQGVLVQAAGRGVAAYVPQCPGEVSGSRPRVLVIIAEPAGSWLKTQSKVFDLLLNKFCWVLIRFL